MGPFESKWQKNYILEDPFYVGLCYVHLCVCVCVHVCAFVWVMHNVHVMCVYVNYHHISLKE